MNSPNLYQLLEIPDYSDILIVKKSFRRLALLYHPDRNPAPEAAEKFKTLVNAYEILNDPLLKQNYDSRLRNGFNYESIPIPSTDSIRDKQKQWYAKMRKDRDEMQEVENITAYENSLLTIPFIWRLIIIGLLQLTGIVSILSDWYQKGNKIALGIFLFVFASLFLWNELYKHFWHKSLTKDEKKYDRQAYSWFLTVFFIGVFATLSLIRLKKAWHLHNFGKVIYANYQVGNISYKYNGTYYLVDIYSVPEGYENYDKVLIRISTMEPEIWEYVNE